MKIKKTFRLIFLNECFLFILNTWQQWLRILVRRESLWSISLYLVNGVEYSASHGILFSISGTSLDELKLWARQCNIKSNWHLKVYFYPRKGIWCCMNTKSNRVWYTSLEYSNNVCICFICYLELSILWIESHLVAKSKTYTNVKALNYRIMH